MGNTPSKPPHGVSMWNTDAQQQGGRHIDPHHPEQQQHHHHYHHRHRHPHQPQDQHSHIQSTGPEHEEPSFRDASSEHPDHSSHPIPDDEDHDYEQAHPASPQSARRPVSHLPSRPQTITGKTTELEAMTRDLSLDLDLDDRPLKDGQEQSGEAAATKPTSPEPSKAVQVPSSTNPHSIPAPSMQPEIIDSISEAISPSGPPASSYYGILQRPPWMPLPIGDADTAPGSPIIPESDTNAQALIDDAELASVPPLDSTDCPGDETAGPPTVSDSEEHLDAGNQEDDEMEDELDSYPRTGSDAVVPTTIEWHGHGDNVFVTGTFVNWGRKFRLRPSENDPNVMSVVLKLREGTHHLKFIVDNVMRTSYRLPTAVDFTNHLVNYIEVVPPEPRGATERHHAPQVVAAPIATEATTSRGREAATPGRPGTNADIVPSEVAPVNTDTTTVEPVPVENRPTADQPSMVEEDEDIQPMADTRVVIPQLLEDIDVDEDTPSYQQAANVISEMTTPPTLPLFLAKSILNGHTPAKDDNSVLNYPNHTVLNHLATSSIKNGVLATSVTTRYKRKYVTTILYKPAGDVEPCG